MMNDYWDTQLPENVSFDTVMQSAADLRKDYDDMKAQRDALLAACEAIVREYNPETATRDWNFPEFFAEYCNQVARQAIARARECA